MSRSSDPSIDKKSAKDASDGAGSARRLSFFLAVRYTLHVFSFGTPFHHEEYDASLLHPGILDARCDVASIGGRFARCAREATATHHAILCSLGRHRGAQGSLQEIDLGRRDGRTHRRQYPHAVGSGAEIAWLGGAG